MNITLKISAGSTKTFFLKPKLTAPYNTAEISTMILGADTPSIISAQPTLHDSRPGIIQFTLTNITKDKHELFLNVTFNDGNKHNYKINLTRDYKNIGVIEHDIQDAFFTVFKHKFKPFPLVPVSGVFTSTDPQLSGEIQLITVDTETHLGLKLTGGTPDSSSTNELKITYDNGDVLVYEVGVKVIGTSIIFESSLEFESAFIILGSAVISEDTNLTLVGNITISGSATIDSDAEFLLQFISLFNISGQAVIVEEPQLNFTSGFNITSTASIIEVSLPITDLAWYYDTIDDTSFSDGSSVSSIAGQQGSISSQTYSETGSARPTYDADGLNLSERAIFFDGVNDRLMGDGLIPQGKSSFTVAMLADFRDSIASHIWRQGSGPDNTSPHLKEAGSDALNFDMFGNSLELTLSTVNDGDVAGLPIIIICQYDASTEIVTLLASDGINKESVTKSNPDVNIGDPSINQFGFNQNRSSDPNWGALAVYHKALTTQEQDDLIEYWSNKYGLNDTPTLPVTDLAWYYDTIDDSSFSDGDSVSSIVGQQGARKTITFSNSGSARPTYDADGFNGSYRSISFDGVDDFLESSTHIFSAGQQPITCAVLAVHDSPNFCYFTSQGANASGQGLNLTCSGNIVYLDSNGSDFLAANIGSTTRNKKLIVIGSYVAGTASLRVAGDGKNDGEQAKTWSLAETNMFLGTPSFNTANVRPMHIVAVGFWDKVLTVQEQAHLIKYWSNKYGI